MKNYYLSKIECRMDNLTSVLEKWLYKIKKVGPYSKIVK